MTRGSGVLGVLGGSGTVRGRVRCVADTRLADSFATMDRPKRRFEIQLPAERRAELDALAREVGTGAADLARLAIVRLLNDREVLIGGKAPPARSALADLR